MRIEKILVQLGVDVGPRATAGQPASPCYTPALMAETGRSSASRATERARDGASRAGPESVNVTREP